MVEEPVSQLVVFGGGLGVVAQSLAEMVGGRWPRAEVVVREDEGTSGMVVRPDHSARRLDVCAIPATAAIRDLLAVGQCRIISIDATAAELELGLMSL